MIEDDPRSAAGAASWIFRFDCHFRFALAAGKFRGQTAIVHAAVLDKIYFGSMPFLDAYLEEMAARIRTLKTPAEIAGLVAGRPIVELLIDSTRARRGLDAVIAWTAGAISEKGAGAIAAAANAIDAAFAGATVRTALRAIAAPAIATFGVLALFDLPYYVGLVLGSDAQDLSRSAPLIAALTLGGIVAWRLRNSLHAELGAIPANTHPIFYKIAGVSIAFGFLGLAISSQTHV